MAEMARSCSRQPLQTGWAPSDDEHGCRVKLPQLHSAFRALKAYPISDLQCLSKKPSLLRHVGYGSKSNPRGPQVLVHVSIC